MCCVQPPTFKIFLLIHLTVLALLTPSAMSQFKRVRTQFIAALGDPQATSGTGASSWGIWRVDPGPRGVRLSDAKQLIDSGVSAAGWTYDNTEFWIEEHGLIMEKPDFPLPPGKYVVTGGREITTVLTISDDGDQWSLEDGARLHDVTHLPCRSARYTPVDSASAASARPEDFPVTPGGAMPDVPNCKRQDYWVVFVQALEVTSGVSDL